MNPPSVSPAPESFTESRKTALLKLLTDDDPAIHHLVREKILASGRTAIDWLRPHTLSGDPALRRRTREIIRQLSRQAADDAFLAFCLQHGEGLDLERGAWLLAQTQYPEINLEAYQAVFDSHAGEMREQMDLRADADEVLGAFNRYVFEVLGFHGNEENYHDPENSYLNRVVDRRTGNPISLCLVYLLLARRLRLPVTGIGLPGHFICRFQTSSEEYYLDVFNRGKLWTKANCIQYLLHGNYELQDEYLAPVSPRRMLLRICGNLHQIYQHQQMAAETLRFQRYLVALAR